LASKLLVGIEIAKRDLIAELSGYVSDIKTLVPLTDFTEGWPSEAGRPRRNGLKEEFDT
jgi:hypothetical protein